MQFSAPCWQRRARRRNPFVERVPKGPGRRGESIERHPQGPQPRLGDVAARGQGAHWRRLDNGIREQIDEALGRVYCDPAVRGDGPESMVGAYACHPTNTYKSYLECVHHWVVSGATKTSCTLIALGPYSLLSSRSQLQHSLPEMLIEMQRHDQSDPNFRLRASFPDDACALTRAGRHRPAIIPVTMKREAPAADLTPAHP